jgi:hypothetical protein
LFVNITNHARDYLQIAYYNVMKLVFYFGWFLIVLALASVSAEHIVRGSGILVPAYDLWFAISAKHFTISQIRIERISISLWDPVLKTILHAPAWFLIGAPGIVFAWVYRPNRFLSAADEDDHHKYEEELFLIDKLSREAKVNGHVDNNEDYYIAPDYYDNFAFEGVNIHVDSNEDYYIAPDYYDNSVFEKMPKSMNEEMKPKIVPSNEILPEAKKRKVTF